MEDANASSAIDRYQFSGLGGEPMNKGVEVMDAVYGGLASSAGAVTKDTEDNIMGNVDILGGVSTHNAAAELLASEELPTEAGVIGETLKKSKINRKRRAASKIKDANAPKAPATGYVTYMNERRDQIKLQSPYMSFSELTKTIAAEWSAMDAALKKRYLDESDVKKVKYLEELAGYQQTEAYRLFQKKKKNAELEKVKISSITRDAVPAGEKKDPAFASVKIPGLDISIFTEEFLDHNKSHEKELRELRKLNMIYEEQNAVLSKHVDELKLVVTRLQGETAQQRNTNIALVQHLETLRELLTASFASLSLPDTNEVPTVATVDTYMIKLHQIILGSPQEHGELIAAVREIVNKLNLESYVS